MTHTTTNCDWSHWLSTSSSTTVDACALGLPLLCFRLVQFSKAYEHFARQ